jgi:hypothetical protein
LTASGAYAVNRIAYSRRRGREGAPSVDEPTSILLEPGLIETLRRKGAKRRLGYQTMLKLVVREHLDEY